MIKCDWNVFKNKFSENLEETFEWFCYLLFCKEFGKEVGIERYRNQSGIETEPIKVNNKIIGWQAKFYEEKLYNKKKVLLEMLDKVKKSYPDINKIILYTNQEWGEGKGKERNPKGKLEIEKKAKDLKLEIEWRTSSYFDSPFVSQTNKEIASYFFNKQDNFLERLNQIKLESERIINQVEDKIKYQNYEISFDRKEKLDLLKESIKENKITIVLGESGVGKTALIKTYYEKNKNKNSIYILRSEQIKKIKDINELFGYDFYKFLNFYKNEEINTKIIIIDSLEKLVDFDIKIFNDLLYELKEWKIVCTLQEEFFKDIESTFFYDEKVNIIKIEKLELKELENIAEKNNFLLPIKSKKTMELIKIPFYLKEYLKCELNEDINFKDKIWNRIKDKEYFLKLIEEKIKNNLIYIENYDSNLIQNLLTSNILKLENTNLYVCHDLYEELAIEKIIEAKFANCLRPEEIIERIEKKYLVKKVFRRWIIDKLSIDDKKIKELVRNSIFNIEEGNKIWLDEVLVAMLLSDYSEKFFKDFKSELLKDDCKLLDNISKLLKIRCKETKNPIGKGWEQYIQFFCDNFEEINNLENGIKIIENGYIIIKSNKELLKKVGDVAIEILNNERNNNLFIIILNIALEILEIKEKVKNIFQNFIKNPFENNKYGKFIRYIFENEIYLLIFFKEALELTNLFWKQQKEKKYGYSLTYDSRYGLNEKFYSNYTEATPYLTFINTFLYFKFEETLDFIINFTNECIENYKKSKIKEYEIIDLYIDTEVNTQIINRDIWNLYRGIENDSKLLSSIHMALEKNLLEIKRSSDEIERILIKILKNSKSASLTAVVTSIATANFTTQIKVNKILFKTKELFYYDKMRKSRENLGITRYIWNKFIREERVRSDKLEHRKIDLLDILFNYLINNKEKKEIYKILDNHYNNLKPNEKEIKINLLRLDLRNYEEIEGKLNLKKEIEEEIIKEEQNFLKKNYSKFIILNDLKLRVFLEKEIEIKSDSENKYFELLKNKEKEMNEKIKEDGRDQVYESLYVILICCLIKNYYCLLTDKEKLIHKRKILEYLKKNKEYYSELSLKKIIENFPDIIKNSEDKETLELLQEYLSNITLENIKVYKEGITKLQSYYSEKMYDIIIKFLLLKYKESIKETNENKILDNLKNIELDNLIITLKLIACDTKSDKQKNLIKILVRNIFLKLEDKKEFCAEYTEFSKIYMTLILSDRSYIKLFEKNLKNFKFLYLIINLFYKNFSNLDDKFFDLWDRFVDIVIENLNKYNDKNLVRIYLFDYIEETFILNLIYKKLEILIRIIRNIKKIEIILESMLRLIKIISSEHYLDGIYLFELIIEKSDNISYQEKDIDSIGNCLTSILDEKINSHDKIEKERIKKILIFLDNQEKSSLIHNILEKYF